MTILDEIAAYTSQRMTAEEEQVSTASPLSVQRCAGKAGPFVYLRS